MATIARQASGHITMNISEDPDVRFHITTYSLNLTKDMQFLKDLGHISLTAECGERVRRGRRASRSNSGFDSDSRWGKLSLVVKMIIVGENYHCS